MGELFLVRHGQASFGADDYDKLSDLGHRQSEWLGHYFGSHNLRFDRAISGNLTRQRETLAGIGRAMSLPPAEEDARLDEFHYAPMQEEYLAVTGSDMPQNRSDFLKLFPQMFSEWTDGNISGSGETYAAFETRVSGAVKDALDVEKRNLVVTSGGVISIVLRQILQLTPVIAADLMLNIHNSSITRIQFEDGALRLSQFNATPHLEPIDRVALRTYI